MPQPYFTSKHNLARLLANADYHPLAREFPAELSHYDDIEATFDRLKSELNQMTNYNPDLLNIFGTRNAWICKPGSSCCGKGISIISGKRKILNYIIENPGVCFINSSKIVTQIHKQGDACHRTSDWRHIAFILAIIFYSQNDPGIANKIPYFKFQVALFKNISNVHF